MSKKHSKRPLLKDVSDTSSDTTSDDDYKKRSKPSRSIDWSRWVPKPSTQVALVVVLWTIGLWYFFTGGLFFIHYTTPGRYAGFLRTEVTFAHSVNTTERVAEAFASGVHIIEVEVTYYNNVSYIGTLPSSVVPLGPALDVYLPHPVQLTDPTGPTPTLPFAKWLDNVVSRQTNRTNGHLHDADLFGIKLNFKDPKAVRPALNELELLKAKLQMGRPHIDHFKNAFEWHEEIGMALWLSADLIPGPNGPHTMFKADEFVTDCHARFPGAVISIGFTEGPQHERGYDGPRLKAMLDLVHRHEIAENVNFEVVGWAAEKSWKQTEQLLLRVPGSTMTIKGSVSEQFLAFLLPSTSRLAAPFGRVSPAIASRIFFDTHSSHN